MKTHIVLPLIFVVLVSGILSLHSADVEVLDNASVIALQKLNLGDPVVIEKIKTSRCNFDTSIKGLTELKQANVSSAVIQAMLATKSAASPAPAAPVPSGDLNNPVAPHPCRVWVLQEPNGQKTMARVEYLRPILQNAVRGYNPWTGVSHEQFVYLPGPKSKLELSERRPVFYFYFVTGQQLSTQGGSYEFLNAQSPAEFMLTRFQVKDGQRQISVSRGNAWYQSQGINKGIHGFESEKVSEGIYKVTFKKDLANGQYAFSSANGQGFGQCFHFGIASTNAWVVDKEISDPEVKRLCEILKTGKPEERIKALKTLREMDAPESVPDIVACLNHPNSNVMRDACRTLAVLGDTSNIPAIEPLLKHSRSDVRKDAQDAINALSAR